MKNRRFGTSRMNGQLGLDVTATKQVGVDRQKLVLMCLMMHARKGLAYPSAETIGEKTNLGRWVARDSLKALEAQGIISKVGKMGRAIKWRIHLREVSESMKLW